MYLIVFLLSIWQSILLWNKKPGISVLLFVFPLVILLIGFLKHKGKIKNEKAKLIAIPIVLLACTYFIYNNSLLNKVNMLAIPVLIVLMVIELICDKFTLEKVIRNVLLIIFKPIFYFGTVLKNVLNKITRKDNSETRKPKNIKRIVKAVIISIPVLLLVFILLITADSDFSKLFINVVKFINEIVEKIEISDVKVRTIMIALVFFYMAGFMENINLTNDIERNKKEIKSKDNLSMKFIITILNVMYLIFCIIQIKTLFKIFTMDNSYTTNGLVSYAYYARQGFFQLMVVSAINLIVIINSKKKCYDQEKYINIMNLIMIGLTTIILASSFIRMYIYQNSYGFTIKRLLVFWAEITEGILLVPTAIYVLDKKINLVKTYFITITSMYIILNFANINRIIANRNVNMYIKRKSVSLYNVNYLTQLGSDAIPEVVKLLDIIDETDKQDILSGKRYKNGKLFSTDETEEESEYYFKKVTISELVEMLNQENNEIYKQKTSWQEFNISKIMAKKILKEKLK